MNNKAFTLIELLAVVILLSIIVFLVLPNVVNLLKDKETEIDELTYTIIKDAAKLYMDDNKQLYKKISGDKYCISLNKLVKEGYLKDNIKYNGKNITNLKNVQITYLNGYDYELVDIDECNYTSVDLDDNLVPVVYEENNWVVTNINKNWYDYDNQQWANAVILRNDVEKKVGDIVTVDGANPEVLAMFVWIPRYEYKISGKYGKNGTSKTNPGEIEINLIPKTQTTATEGYRIHPAFTFGNTQLSGIWVGKFETSHVSLSNSKTKNNLGCIDENCESADGLRILPNKISLRNNNISNFFFASRSMSRDNNEFGINKKLMNSHMIKNVEWAAVSYLSQSKYGKYGNNDYVGINKEVYINSSSEYITGSSSENAKSLWRMENGVYKSTNTTNNSSSDLIFKFQINNTSTLTFDWSVSSESPSYDYVYYTITKNGSILSDTGQNTKIGGTSYGTSESSLQYLSVSKTLEKGSYVVTFTYKKDGSVNKGTDKAYVKNFKINNIEVQTIISILLGVGSSTTGNIYGIYDMSGGAWEYVMGVFSNSDGVLWSGSSVANNSGFKGKVGVDGNDMDGLNWPDEKYYDVYKATSGTTISASTACNGGVCYGHALSETANWYNDYVGIVASGSPWLIRSARYHGGDHAGVFFSNGDLGHSSEYGSTRIVITKN